MQNIALGINISCTINVYVSSRRAVLNKTTRCCIVKPYLVCNDNERMTDRREKTCEEKEIAVTSIAIDASSRISAFVIVSDLSVNHYINMVQKQK